MVANHDGGVLRLDRAARAAKILNRVWEVA